eukprot:TRINITY_DN573_c0_g1_i1.p3 TRINITY_DN573_c0_g1~~TRINITY_DN573_c0_g1_i1.p3  ORF type:complete len:107 (-),score=27.00 TRINITY_DN573_c0_g1_i1:62-382(-)
MSGATAPPTRTHITLISSDGFRFVVHTEAAMVSGAIRTVLTGPGGFIEQTTGEMNFRDISGAVLERVVQYFYYKLRYRHSSADIPPFHIEPEYALEMLMAANFLDT